MTQATFTNILYQERTDLRRRPPVPGLVFQSRYRVQEQLEHQRALHACSSRTTATTRAKRRTCRATTSAIGDYPEAFPENRYYPDGRLQSFQRNRFRLWSIYNFGMGAGGRSVGFRPLARRRRARVQPRDQKRGHQRPRSGRSSRPRGIRTRRRRRTCFSATSAGRNASRATGCWTCDINYNIPVFKSLRPVAEVRHLQSVQQPEADWLQHDGQAEHRGRRRIQRRPGDDRSPRRRISVRRRATRKPTWLHGHQFVPAGVRRRRRAGGRTFRVALGFRF